MSRKDLLQILVLQSKENDKLKQELEEKNKIINSRKILIDEAGSIAEASLKINKVFESAQLAADQYLKNIKRLESEQLKNLK